MRRNLVLVLRSRRRLCRNRCPCPAAAPRILFLHSPACRKPRAQPRIPSTLRDSRPCSLSIARFSRRPRTRNARRRAGSRVHRHPVSLEGLEPAGDNGTYFQNVPLFAVHTVEDKTKFSFVPARASRSTWPMAPRSFPKTRPARLRPTSTLPLSLSATAFTRPNTNGTTTPAQTAKRSISTARSLLSSSTSRRPTTKSSSRVRPSPTTAAGPTSMKKPRAAEPSAFSSFIALIWPVTAGMWSAIAGRGKELPCKATLATLRAAAWIQHDVAQRLSCWPVSAISTRPSTAPANPAAFHALNSRSCAPISRAASAAMSAQMSSAASPASAGQPGRPLHRPLRPSRHRSRRQGRQHLQRRCR